MDYFKVNLNPTDPTNPTDPIKDFADFIASYQSGVNHEEEEPVNAAPEAPVSRKSSEPVNTAPESPASAPTKTSAPEKPAGFFASFKKSFQKGVEKVKAKSGSDSDSDGKKKRQAK